MDTGLAVVAGLVLAVIALRRARGVVHPELRRAQSRPVAAGRASAGGGAIGSRYRRAVIAAQATVRVAVGLAALAGIVWLTRQLFG